MEPRAPSFRYGAVLVCATAALVWLIIAPSSDWAHGVAFALEGLALAIAVSTAATRPKVQRARAVAIGVVAGLLVVVVATGLVPPEGAAALSALAGTGASLALVGGLIRLVRRHGVTLQAVAGALAIYVQLGLIFAWLIGFVSHMSDKPYFTQGGDGSQSERVYFSFTVMTTTGFGDFTAAQPLGRGIAVVEMLVGQIYLVTVIGVLVGGLVGRRRD
jgi:Ion channel